MDRIKVRVYYQDLGSKNYKGFEESFKDYKDIKRYLKERKTWTTFRTLILIKGEQIEDQDKEDK